MTSIFEDMQEMKRLADEIVETADAMLQDWKDAEEEERLLNPEDESHDDIARDENRFIDRQESRTI